VSELVEVLQRLKFIFSKSKAKAFSALPLLMQAMHVAAAQEINLRLLPALTKLHVRWKGLIRKTQMHALCVFRYS